MPDIYIVAVKNHIKNYNLEKMTFFSYKSHSKPISEHTLRNKYKKYAELVNFPHGTKFVN